MNAASILHQPIPSLPVAVLFEQLTREFRELSPVELANVTRGDLDWFAELLRFTADHMPELERAELDARIGVLALVSCFSWNRSTCTVCGGTSTRDRPELHMMDRTCNVCGWHFSSSKPTGLGTRRRWLVQA